jgi:selenocysteine-specific elongation factor
LIIALAGHVDHGKTALIRALTGVDTDRLPDEKRRGMTIDLGFAYAALPSGEIIGFVDVPGHERFLQNMLAGVLTIGSVLLIVAADDGPMPQTLEHLAILRLTGVTDLTAVITKTDRVDDARLAGVRQELTLLLAGNGFPGVPILAASSLTGQGVPELRAWLEQKARAARKIPEKDDGFRLSIDRSFALTGVGLVVTGTVAAGSVRLGDSLLLSPPRLAARVRSIHVQDRPAETARAGDRCALAITGARIEREKLRRGDWLVDPRLHAPTALLDARVGIAEGRKLRHGTRIHAHLGAAAIPGRVRVLEGGDLESGGAGFVHLLLDRPAACLYGDRIVLRDDGTGRIVAGGVVLDPFPPERRRRHAARLATLAAQTETDPAVALQNLLAVEGSVDLQGFALARNLDPARLAALAAGLPGSLIGREHHRVMAAPATADSVRSSLLCMLGEWHAAHPDYAGPGKAALLARVSREFPAKIAEAVLHDLLATGAVVQQDAAFRLPEHRPALPAADEALWARIEMLLAAAALRPPRVRELMEALDLPLEATEALLERLARFGRLLRVAPNRFFLPRTIAEIATLAARLAGTIEERGFTAADFNRATGIGRNLAIEVLEFLDKAGITQRTGDLRHVVRTAEEAFGFASPAAPSD